MFDNLDSDWQNRMGFSIAILFVGSSLFCLVGAIELWDQFLRINNPEAEVARISWDALDQINRIANSDSVAWGNDDHVDKLAAMSTREFIDQFGFSLELKRRFLALYVSSIRRIPKSDHLVKRFGAGTLAETELEEAFDFIHESTSFGVVKEFRSNSVIGRYRLNAMTRLSLAVIMCLLAVSKVYVVKTAKQRSEDLDLLGRLLSRRARIRRLRSVVLLTFFCVFVLVVFSVAKFAYPNDARFEIPVLLIGLLIPGWKLIDMIRRLRKGDMEESASEVRAAELALELNRSAEF